MPGILLAFAALFGAPQRVQVPPPLPAEYRCEGDWQTPGSRLLARATLSADGHLESYHLTWLRYSTDYRVAGWVTQFDFEGARLPAPGDDWSLLLTLNGFAPGTRIVRVDLLRRGEDGVDTVALSSPRTRATAWIMTNWRRNAVRAALTGAPELIVRVTDRHGQTRLSHRLPSAVLDGPTEASAARHAQIEAMVADYRNRCDFIPEGADIVVT